MSTDAVPPTAPRNDDPTPGRAEALGTAAMVAGLGDGFASEVRAVNGTSIHYVRGGQGPPLVLLHGFPQDWSAWRRIMPRLAARFTVLALDLRGVGESAAPRDGYDTLTLADDVAALLTTLALGPAHVVGHDIGGLVAYTLARRHPRALRDVAVLEVPLPGIDPPDAPAPPSSLWHGAFHMVPGLAEDLVRDRQARYFRYFFDTFAGPTSPITDRDIEHYAAAYAAPDHLRAGFEFYRAMPTGAADNAARTEPTELPLLLVGGEHMFGPSMPALARHLRSHHGWRHVTVRVLDGGHHYLPDEQPERIAALIEEHARP